MKFFSNSNTASTGGKATTGNACKTCGGKGTVRVSKPRKGKHDSPARQQYDIVTERCPDC